MKAKRLKVVVVLALVALVAGAAFGRKYLQRARGRLPGLNAQVDTGPRTAGPIAVAETIYDGKLAPGWDDWGWGPHRLGGGPAGIVFANYGGWLLHHAEMHWRFGGLSFRFKAPASWGEFLQVNLRQNGKPEDAFPVVLVEPRHVAVVEGGWHEVLIEGKELNPERQPFDRVLIGARRQVGGEWAEIDKVVLTEPSESETQLGKLSVSCNGPSHPISELIYGGSAEDWDSGQSALRIGGNPLSRAHWELGAWNTGHDWFFQNVGQPSNIFQMLARTGKEQRQVALVAPLLGWVAKDKTSFSFPRQKFPSQRKFDAWKPDSGDGYDPTGKPLPPLDPTQTSVEAPPELIQAWIKKILAQDAASGGRSVHMYILDNEPTLWNVTHRDVHPAPLSYDELLERTIKYATAIREADPGSLIAGPAEWGFTGYMYSAVDREAGFALQPDRAAHGNQPLVAWYLKRLAEHEKATGKSLLDVFDLHFYPAADGLYGGDAGTDPAKAALRVRSTRALWDPSYVDESWINEKVRLIPRMKEWVAANYPGRKLSIGEWCFGADDHISGGLATAEALGRFGQQGLDAAFHWGELKPGSASYWAFRAYRNFDGRGARFEASSLPTREMENVSLFASRNAAGTRVVLVVVNRDPTAKLSSKIELQNCGRPKSSRRFSFGPESKELAHEPSQVVDDSVPLTLEPFSFAVLELELEPN